MQHPIHATPKRWQALLVAVALIAAPVTAGVTPGLAPAHASDGGSLVLSALDTLQRYYVDPVQPVALLNAAIAALRASTHAGPDALPDIAPGTPSMEAQQEFLAAFDRAAQYGGEPADQLAYDTTESMLASLHDTHVYYLDPSKFQENRAQLDGNAGFTGIGVMIVGQKDAAGVNWVFVDSVFPGSPAEQSGVRRFDRILAVDGRSLQNADVRQASQLIRGPAGSPVVLTIGRGGATYQTTVVRAPIRTAPAAAQVLQPGVAYVHLYEFSKGATRAVRTSLEQLGAQGPIRSIILDLRGNPGGLINEAGGVASLFVPRGTVLARIRDRDSANTLRAMGPAPYADVPLIVLTNRGSASGAEIVAGAFKDLRRAELVGEKTAGALGGAVDVPLPEGGMSVTVERITTPMGHVVEGVGIQPDMTVVLGEQDMEQGIDPQLAAALRAAGAMSLSR